MNSTPQNTDQIDGYTIPIDPINDLHCDSCQ